METLEEILGSNVKTRREAAGLSQKKLAEDAGVSESLVIRLEKGSQETKRENLKAIAGVLKCSIVDLHQAPQKAEQLTFSQAADVLVRLSNLKPVKRQIALALIFQDASHVSDKRLAQLIRPLLKAQE